MNALVHSEPVAQLPAPANDSRTLMTIIERLATNPEIDLARVEKLLDLKRQWDAEEARKAFVAAMAAFKADPPTIFKDKHVKYTTSKGTTEYDHATLGALCDAIVKGLSKYGISHRWDVGQADNRVKVTCVLTHAMGHSESVSMNGPIDDSGGKNAIQAIASSVTYLERYTLFAATGLAAQEDDDGRGAGGEGGQPSAEGSNKPTAPAGYADWQKSMETTASKGLPALQAAWREAWGKQNGFCGYAGTTDIKWWNDLKAKASAVSKPKEAAK